MTMTGGGRPGGETRDAGGSRRIHHGAPVRRVGMRGSLQLSMTRKWVFPHPIIQRSCVCLRSLVGRSGARSRTAIEPAAFASGMSWMKMSALTHREPTWKDTNAPVRARGYNKLSARICAEWSRSDEGAT